MKSIALTFALLLTSATAFSQTNPAAKLSRAMSDWTGVWEVKQTGKPGITITLADDGGALTGTIVFEVMNRETDKRIAIEPRTVVNPHLEGSALTFQVRRILKPHLKDDTTSADDKPETDIADMTLTPTAEGKATLTCAKCGEASPTEVVKEK